MLTVDTPLAGIAWRIVWTIATIVVVEALICGAALVPVVFLWSQITASTSGTPALRGILYAVAFVPSYVLFSLGLMIVSRSSSVR